MGLLPFLLCVTLEDRLRGGPRRDQRFSGQRALSGPERAGAGTRRPPRHCGVSAPPPRPLGLRGAPATRLHDRGLSVARRGGACHSGGGFPCPAAGPGDATRASPAATTPAGPAGSQPLPSGLANSTCTGDARPARGGAPLAVTPRRLVHDPESRRVSRWGRASVPASQRGRDDLRLSPSSNCRPFDRGSVRFSAGVDSARPQPQAGVAAPTGPEHEARLRAHCGTGVAEPMATAARQAAGAPSQRAGGSVPVARR